jgi:DNA-binding NarL/FixJ family response regulator
MSLSRPHIHTSPMSSFGRRQRAILVVGPCGSIPDKYKSCLERELPWAVLEEVECVEKACGIFPETVALILLHPDALEAAEASAQQLRRYHPLALIGLLQLDSSAVPQARDLITHSRILQGVLPIAAKIHDFVAIVSFMMRGGEYFPREIFVSEPAEAPVAPPQAKPAPSDDSLGQLTRRELEILEMVAQGLQNKSIAARLNLSEFTVKIHLHNIITKLGAHNRTEAAAFFRRDHPVVASAASASR